MRKVRRSTYRSGGSFGLDSDNEPLLSPRERKRISTNFTSLSESLSISGSYGTTASSSSEEFEIERHMNLGAAIGFMVGSCSGAGIFVSPTGVTRSVGSVGASLLVWTACGLLNLVLALCYAELGSALPIAGGDYAYVYYVLGPFPGFLCLWIMVIIVGPIAAAIMGRTIGLYFNAALDLDCSTSLIVAISLVVVVTASALNMFSIKWSSRLVTLFSFGKIIAMAILVTAGLVNLASGYTGNFENIFEGTTSDPGGIVVAFLPGSITYAGWDYVNALAEEMKNPKRDIPIAAAVSLILVTALYVLVNVAYFTMLSPQEFIASDAVAMSFAQKAFPSVSWIITVFVMFACAGTALNIFLAAPRWAFAGGRDRQLPTLLSHVSVKYMSPLPAIVFMMILASFFGASTYFGVQELFDITGLQVQLKVVLALIALLHLKRTRPELERTIKIPFLLVLLALLMLLGITGIAVYQNPLINGIGLGLFLLGMPIYFIKEWCGRQDFINNIMDGLTSFLQRLMFVVPTGGKKS